MFLFLLQEAVQSNTRNPVKRFPLMFPSIPAGLCADDQNQDLEYDGDAPECRAKLEVLEHENAMLKRIIALLQSVPNVAPNQLLSAPPPNSRKCPTDSQNSV